MLTFKINLPDIKRKLLKYAMNNNEIAKICQICVLLGKWRNVQKYAIKMFVCQSIK